MNPTSTDALPFRFRPLWRADRPVWAHYFPTFPMSIDNKAAEKDYYNTQFLTTTGESGKHDDYGGYLRNRPLPVPPLAESPNKQTYSTRNMQTEVRMAIARGITGFFYNIMSYSSGSAGGSFQWLLEAAAQVDPRFQIMPMFDMNGMYDNTLDECVTIIEQASAFESLYRLPDGRIVLGSYNAMKVSLDWWENLFEALNAKNLPVAFIAGMMGGLGDAGVLNPVSWGVAPWGTATPGASSAINPDKAHAAGLKALAPIDPQQSRPKSKGFWEAGNSQAFRNSWMAAIETGCELVQIITWSDYSECSQVCPYTDSRLDGSIGTGFFDLNAYYATWFATGEAPEITQDVLYFFHRRGTAQMVHPNQPAEFVVNASGAPEQDYIEVVAFLIAPGLVQVTIGGEIYREECEDGITPLRVPLAPGVPTFTLIRNGSEVFSSDGPLEIFADEDGLPEGLGVPWGVLDMTYWNGSITAAGLTRYSIDD